MKAKTVLFDEVGAPEVLRIEEVELGAPGPGEVRVRVEAMGLNRSEALFRAGAYYYAPDLPASRIGAEAAGVIEEVGPEVEGFAAGDPVTVLATAAGAMSAYGVYAERVNVPASTLFRRHPSVDAVTGAATWLSYLTAYGALVEIGGLRPGDTVLITAASSSVGIAAIQVANLVGAVPIAVTRTVAKREQLLKAGAARVITLDEDDLVALMDALTDGAGARVVFDAVGGPEVSRLAGTVARDGMLIVYGSLDGRPTPLPPHWPLAVYGFALPAVLDHDDRKRRATAFIESGLRSGALSPLIDRTFPLHAIADAHRHLEGNGQVGKIVVTVGLGDGLREARRATSA
ncbi:zinc-dependent alcohol dehydrogenase family protein [Streptomyces mobaraensis NBRC 13819 = DSM 40847]|uniref:Zinc-dependent alcohol dehydrogenase family protein n=2 Tax=Streptomyces mobaraensis TaxID=35621 RepID=A0A5N5WC81_STRMB|nr:zinc-dependent alcohol dehydrogenase family protein [Streptomyces mobaraensis]EME96586.1 oxidoreductase, zinc-containing alcohol dehydrogenase [Streptomyces mobaraensis NBRC 13819 = DSM 40847]KAB7849243.1 zinc-dependent alcohol dehydrogenase family protein [Streptomyces mobaraensis]QTT73602.1 zinc-dependent alcohol dehydrogenase family protein [Streptomyces mobaraensis NBRC 13819 = DSM 40847]